MRRAGALAVWLFASSAGALGWGTSNADVPLGPGVVAHRYRALRGLAGWRTEGFAPPPGADGYRVEMYARAPGNRIVAVVPGGIAYTDDRGAHWMHAGWDGPQQARTLDFDLASGFGVAVGTGGAVWASRDGGASWQSRREGTETLVDVAVLGEAAVWTSARGAVTVSRDGGSSVRTLVEGGAYGGPMPVLAVYERAIWVRAEGAGWWRVDASGSVERAERSPWDR